MYKQGTKEFEHHVATYGPQSQVRLQGLHPAVQGREVRRAARGRRSSRRRARATSCRWPSTTTASRCTTAPFTDWSRGQDGAEARHGRRAGRRPCAPRAWSSASSSHRAEHWWFFDEGMKFDSDVRDPRYAGLYGPAARPGDGPRTGATPPDAGVPRRLAGAHAPSSSTSTSPQLVWFDWWIAQPRRPAVPADASPPSTTTAARSGARASRSTTRSTGASRSPTPRACSTSSAASSRPSGRSSGRPTPRSRRTRGATSTNQRVQDRRTRSSTTSSTSSARTAACC